MKTIQHTTETLRARTTLSEQTGCWEWSGFRSPREYGIVAIRRKIFRAHRLMWEVTSGPIPDGMFVLHRCDNPPCVNPDHLFLGTHDDNMADCKAKGRQTRLFGDRNASRRRPERVCRGEQVGTSKLTAAEVLEIFGKYATGNYHQKQLAEEHGVSQAAISDIVKLKKWRHVTCPVAATVQ